MPRPPTVPEAGALVGPRTRSRAVWTGVALVLLTAALVSAPSVLNLYWMRVLSNVFMFAVLAQGLNVMAGYTGYPAFGNVVFFGLGGYAMAVLMVKLQWSFLAAATAATLLCPVLALCLGPMLLRLRGHYFAIATIGLNEAAKEIVLNATEITGGGMGLSLPLPPGTPAQSAAFFYYVLLALMLVSAWVTWEFSRRSLGLACRAIRDDEIKAEAAGLHTTRYKTLAWMISATMTGAAGCVSAYWLTYISAPSLFDMAIAVKAFVIFLLGGLLPVVGPIVAAFAVELLGAFTWSRLLDWHLGAMGVLIMLTILLFPTGVREALRAR